MDLDFSAKKMHCSSSFVFHASDNDIALVEAEASGVHTMKRPEVRRRRHSHIISRRKSIANYIMEGEEGLLLKVDIFLSELERRLDFLESYGGLSVDASISRAFETLQTVRTRCSQASGEVIGAGRRRLHVMVETLEVGYQEGLAAAGSLNEKARVGIELLDSMLGEIEGRASKFRERGLAEAAETLMGEGRRVVDESLEHAREVMHGGFGKALRAAESLEEAIQQAIHRAREHGLIHYNDLPSPWRTNPHVLRGYRFSSSKLECVRSVFSFSNELVNIWSHGLGLIAVLAVAFYFYPSSVNFSLSTKTDIFVAAVFFFAACQCLACSAMWHTMNAIADVDLISMFACVDYTGISLLIAASIMSSEYTAFYCEPASRWIYMTATALLGIGGVIMCFHPKFNGQDMAWARVAFFIGLSATGFMPVLQISWTRGLEAVWEFYSPVIKSIAVYFFGSLVYAAKIPERWSPGGLFDYFGGSHNWWHIAVVFGILFHYNAMQEFFSGAFRRAQADCPPY